VPRVKGGVVTRRRHKKVLNLTKGHKATRHALFAKAHDSLTHALDYAYTHRRERRGDMRRLWIIRINAASRAAGLSYSQFVLGMKKANINIDRKMLAEMAVNDSAGFSRLVKLATDSLKS
jgi:large subunit ribosomal protein L20